MTQIENIPRLQDSEILAILIEAKYQYITEFNRLTTYEAQMYSIGMCSAIDEAIEDFLVNNYGLAESTDIDNDYLEWVWYHYVNDDTMVHLNYAYLSAIIPEFTYKNLGGNTKDPNSYWWENYLSSPRIEAFDKLIQIYNEKVKAQQVN